MSTRSRTASERTAPAMMPIVAKIEPGLVGGFRHPVEGAGMGVGGHDHRDTQFAPVIGDFGVAGGEKKSIPALEQGGAPDAVLDQGAAGDPVKRLSGKAAGGHARGHDSDDLHVAFPSISARTRRAR